MPARDLPPILGGILAGAAGWAQAFGEHFRKALTDVPKDGRLDLGCVLGAGSFEIPNGARADDVVVSDPGTALVSFTLTLLHRLQGIGSAPAIDYSAYAAWVDRRAAQPTA